MPIGMGNSHKIIDWTLDRESIQTSSIGLLEPQVNNVLNQAEPGPIFLVPQGRLALVPLLWLDRSPLTRAY